VGLAAVLAVQRGAPFSVLLDEHQVEAALAGLSLSSLLRSSCTDIRVMHWAGCSC
jgi:hypothetical protein